MPSFGIQITETGSTDAMLGRIEIAMRGKALVTATRAALKPVVRVAKQLVRKGGPRTGKKAGKKHLADTITSAVRDYGEVKVGVAGAAYPAGAHAHLLEYGHDVVRDGKVVGRAPPYPWLRPAAEQTKGEQTTAFVDSLTKSAAEASK